MNSGRIVKMIYSMSTFLYLLFLVFNGIFQGVQLFLQIFKENNSIHAYMFNLIWFFAYPLPLVIVVRFILKRQEIWAFFADWHQVEDRIVFKSQLSDCNVKRLKYVIVSVNWFIYLSLMIIFYNTLMMGQQKKTLSYLLSSYKEIRDNVNLHFVTLFHTASLLLVYVLTSFSDFVPGFIFYHIGLALQSIESEVERNFQRVNQSALFRMVIHEIFLRYEIVSQFTKRANRLFGVLMILNHGIILLLITAFLYSTLFQIQRSHNALIFYFPGFFTLFYFFLASHLLAAQLHSSSSQLISTLSSLLSRHSIHLSPDDYRVAFGFLNHLQHDQLAARPLHLYSITSSNLLTLASLVISYVVVLLQA